MSWTPVGEGRWTWSADDDVHLLLHEAGLLWELHVLYGRAHLHRYVPNGPVLAVQPLDDATWRGTRQLSPPPSSEEEGWQALAAAAAEPEPGEEPS
ncbi:hypothetical protein [Micromonospora sp. NPDC003816]|uniref:hypothetical protein n=1 Tax=Micromonospora sp. NPDC003816 TaxID=3364224 RepID=UPI003697B9AA